MKNGFWFFFGLFFVLALSWAGLVLGTQSQLGDLAPHYDDLEGKSFPERASGLASRGQLVYQDLGCAACHTQQVRRPDYGSDKARGWGDRQSVARDYVQQSRPLLGNSRIGPDLANYGVRAKTENLDAAGLLAYLYNGTDEMPSYRFLFEQRMIVGEASLNALQGVAAAGFELVPTERAVTLVAYLLSLKQTYEFSEARPYTPTASAEGAHE
jgi:cytochrome c oxidase cbb3-type subunit II|uniref:cbb3-type cytochrome c oxidase subunit II n=1 Tax=Cephaloticoccus sp. TaxID=1985742 RepID=UPI0040490FAD